MLIVAFYIFLCDKENLTSLYLAAAFFFFTVKEFTYLLADVGVVGIEIKIIGGVMGFSGGAVFLYVFLAQQTYFKNIRRISRAWQS